ncbi:MAG: hypothetical protein ABJB66_01330 [Gemmatimonadaceae bacterium]
MRSSLKKKVLPGKSPPGHRLLGISLMILLPATHASAQAPLDSVRQTMAAEIDTTKVVTPDSTKRVTESINFDRLVDQDTLQRRRAAVTYSDAYGTRAMIHRRLSYAMVPLFAISYFTGDKLFKDGPNASSFIINTHRASATAVSVLFGVNAVTGGINMWEGRHDSTERKRKLLHSALFLASTAGFTYAGAVLADQAENSLAKRKEHRTVNLISMGLSISSVLVMIVPHD